MASVIHQMPMSTAMAAVRAMWWPDGSISFAVRVSTSSAERSFGKMK